MAERAAPAEPAYLGLLASGVLEERVNEAWEHMRSCDLCARYCRVNRMETVRGAVCRTGRRAVVASHGPHHGEESVLSAWRGSGTIFFSWCNLRCVFCQNWPISQRGEGEEVSTGELAAMMLELQEWGCHNVNLVSPSHVVAPILAAVLEMHRQVGDLVVERRGLALGAALAEESRTIRLANLTSTVPASLQVSEKDGGQLVLQFDDGNVSTFTLAPGKANNEILMNGRRVFILNE